MNADAPFIGPDGFDVAAQIERERVRERGQLVELATVVAGDELRHQGEWLDVLDVSSVLVHEKGWQRLFTCDGPGDGVRLFLAHPLAHRRVRRHAPIRPKVSR